MANANIYKVITEKMIARIESAIENKEKFTWVKPWNGCPTGNYLNYLKDGDAMNEYRGINRLLLDGGLYLTYKQIYELGKKNGVKYTIPKGTPMETVYFYKMRYVDRKDKDGNPVLDENGEQVKDRYAMMRFYGVYNVADIEGLDVQINGTEYDETILTKTADILIKDFMKRTGVKVTQKAGIDKAYYTPSKHTVTVPHKSQFKSIEQFYSTVFHELVHSTGKQLGRDMSGAFGKEKYGFEELVAELGSAFIMQSIGFDVTKTGENSAAYLKSWLKVFKEDTSFIVKASNKAQAASDLFFNITYKEVEKVA